MSAFHFVHLLFHHHGCNNSRRLRQITDRLGSGHAISHCSVFGIFVIIIITIIIIIGKLTLHCHVLPLYLFLFLALEQRHRINEDYVGGYTCTKERSEIYRTLIIFPWHHSHFHNNMYNKMESVMMMTVALSCWVLELSYWAVHSVHFVPILTEDRVECRRCVIET